MLINTTELAEYLGVTSDTIRRWCRDGMPHLRTAGGYLRFDMEAVKEWLNHCNEETLNEEDDGLEPDGEDEHEEWEDEPTENDEDELEELDELESDEFDFEDEEREEGDDAIAA